MHRHRLLLPLNRLAALLKPAAGKPLSAATSPAPLDPVERLHRTGSTFPVMMELTRLGW